MRVRVLSRPRAQAPPLPSLVLFVFCHLSSSLVWLCVAGVCVRGAACFCARRGEGVLSRALCYHYQKKKIQNVPSQTIKGRGCGRVRLVRGCHPRMDGRRGTGRKRGAAKNVNQRYIQKKRPAPSQTTRLQSHKNATEARKLARYVSLASASDGATR